jgi:DNA ligase-1
MFDQLTKSLQDHVINEKPNYYRVSDSLKPDVWFSAAQVWEVRAADLSLSPVHMGGVGLVSYLIQLIISYINPNLFFIVDLGS